MDGTPEAGRALPLKMHFTAGNVALMCLFACACCHSLATYFYSYYRLIFGTLYPSYASYKAIKSKNVKEYARWMMFWVCFGLFSFVEIFSDVFVSFWLPFYYEIKIIFILWLMSPYGNGAKIMYKNVIHPKLMQHEMAIDTYIDRAKDVGISSLHQTWNKLSHTANSVIFNLIQMTHAAILHNMQQTAINGQQSVNYRALLPVLLPSSLLQSSQATVSETIELEETKSTSQQVLDERMDYLTVDSDLESNAFDPMSNLDELDSSTRTTPSSVVAFDSSDSKDSHDCQQQSTKPRTSPKRNSPPLRVRRSVSGDRNTKLRATIRTFRTQSVYEPLEPSKPIIRTPIVTERYRARF
ncbi:Receptor expression-enhancing protein 4 [Halotydeus destructor]|nr:Receptor expression-enhancing protein 4 [Halotydeus destructor]